MTRQKPKRKRKDRMQALKTLEWKSHRAKVISRPVSISWTQKSKREQSLDSVTSILKAVILQNNSLHSRTLSIITISCGYISHRISHCKITPTSAGFLHSAASYKCQCVLHIFSPEKQAAFMSWAWCIKRLLNEVSNGTRHPYPGQCWWEGIHTECKRTWRLESARCRFL